MIGVNFDTTERRETEDRLRLLLDELKHRVKNTLAVVQAIAHQTFRERNADPAALRAFEGRLIALANAHNLLTSSDWESALLSEIASDALRLQGIEGNRFALGGPLIILPAKHALAVALALHELCTNALKHGALSNDSGRVELTWQKADPPRPSLSICWRESGGPHVRPPAHRGFGTRLIETSLAHDLDAQVSLDFVSSGLVCTINARLH
jgi:two-component sensor histidine kinase